MALSCFGGWRAEPNVYTDFPVKQPGSPATTLALGYSAQHRGDPSVSCRRRVIQGHPWQGWQKTQISPWNKCLRETKSCLVGYVFLIFDTLFSGRDYENIAYYWMVVFLFSHGSFESLDDQLDKPWRGDLLFHVFSVLDQWPIFGTSVDGSEIISQTG